MSLNSQPPSSVEEMTPSTTGSHGGCLNLIILFLTWLWIAVIIIGGTLAFLAISSFSLLFPGWYFVTLQIGMGVLLLIPLLLLAILVRAHEYRAVFRPRRGSSSLSREQLSIPGVPCSSPHFQADNAACPAEQRSTLSMTARGGRFSTSLT